MSKNIFGSIIKWRNNTDLQRFDLNIEATFIWLPSLRICFSKEQSN